MQRTLHNLSFERKMDFNMGFVVPIGLQEYLPGDTFMQNTTALIRTSPLVRPVMDRVNCDIFHVAVPFRHIWEEWEDFITGGEDGQASIVAPYFDLNTDSAGGDVGSLADMLGVPSEVGTLRLSALPIRGYQFAVNELFRDQQLQTKAVISLASGADTTTDLNLKRACWGKDLYTTCRPDAQLGDEVAVNLTPQTLAVDGSGSVAVGGQQIVLSDLVGGAGTTDTNLLTGVTAGTQPIYGTGTIPDSSGVYFYKPTGSISGSSIASQLSIDTDGIEAFTIRQFRLANARQRYQERVGSWGARYTELLRSYGVTPEDARLQRPELLGRSRQSIKFSEIVQTGPDGADEGVGSLKGHGITAMRSNRFKKFFSEHGLLYTFMVVRPFGYYIRGLHPLWSRTTKEMYWQKDLELIGKEERWTREVYADGANNALFGYNDRYGDYRCGKSDVAGEFKTSVAYDWHFGRSFANTPVLNDEFVECLPTERVFADQGVSHIQLMASHQVKAARLVGPARAQGGIL